MSKVVRKVLIGLLMGLILACVSIGVLAKQRLEPMPIGRPVYVRFESSTPRKVVLRQLMNEGVVRDAAVAELMAQFRRYPTSIGAGTYKVKPGDSIEQVFANLKSPIHQKVRLREGWWIARQAKILEDAHVCSAQSYIDLTQHPEEFRDKFPFLPANCKTLEGYLYPDTYDFAPELGAKSVIETQLSTFASKVLTDIGDLSKLDKIVTVASIVELEAALNPERARIAGIIENRIAASMHLEIDATVLYALQKWFVLPRGMVRTVDSPYNTYLHPGLPPGPIGAPSKASLLAAANPESNKFLYYVAKSDHSHLFSTTYGEHLANIKKARASG